MTARLNSCQIARKSQGFVHVILPAFFCILNKAEGRKIHRVKGF